MEPDVPRATESLLEEAGRVLPEIRDSFARVLTSLPTRVRRARDIIKVLGVHQTLAWKIMRVVESKDPFAAAQYIPGSEGVNIFLEAARSQEAPVDVIDRARAAMDDYRQLIAEHAGDRASLELMLGASARASHQQTDLTYRKSGFQCASFTWGVQARVRLLSTMLYVDSDPHLMRLANVAGYVGLRRVRPQIRWTLWQSNCGVYDDASTYQRTPYRPLDANGVLPSGVPLLRDFSAVPAEQIVRTVLPSGEAEDQWVDGPVGDKAAITCMTGGVLNTSISRYGDAQNPWHEFGLPVRTPVEMLAIDLFVHRDLFGRIDPHLTVYSELTGRPWYQTSQNHRQDHYTLQFPETVEHLGRGRLVIHNADVPRYDEMMRFAFDTLGWDIDACDVFRVSIPYPVIATAAVLRFAAPLPPPDFTP
jgi:hypothetical protein